MALTDYDKKHLSSSDQKKIQAATDKWNTANAKGDTAGMASAAAEAAAVRNNAGYKTDSSGNYKGSYSGNGNSQYTGSDSNNDLGDLGKLQMSQNAPYQVVLNTLNKRYDKAINTPGLEQYSNDEIQQAMWDYVNKNQSQLWNDRYMEANKQPTYENKYDSKIDMLLNQILNRDDFSYDVQNDPLYKQYADMYEREGDRAMKETMAEAASGAGGMNSYAITAAQQAANRYSSQLNDTIPQLYQLAYDMYLSDIDRKVQNLGLLQNADATQYNRYIDAMNNYRNDKNFAYSMYQDDVANGKWQQQFDYNKAIDERDYNFNDLWTNKAWDRDSGRYDNESAKDEVWRYIEMGIIPNAELIAKAGMTQADVENAVAMVKLGLSASGIPVLSGSPRSSSGSNTVSTYSGGSSGSNAASTYSGGSSGSNAAKVVSGSDSGNGNNGYTGKTEETSKSITKEDKLTQKGMADLGLSVVYDPQILIELYNAGAIYEADGKLHWSAGWNANNFKTNLRRK